MGSFRFGAPEAREPRSAGSEGKWRNRMRRQARRREIGPGTKPGEVDRGGMGRGGGKGARGGGGGGGMGGGGVGGTTRGRLRARGIGGAGTTAPHGISSWD